MSTTSESSSSTDESSEEESEREGEREENGQRVCDEACDEGEREEKGQRGCDEERESSGHVGALSLPGSGLQVKCGRRPAFTEAQKDWIASKCKELVGRVELPLGVYPVRHQMKQALAEGVAEGVFPRSATVEQFRHVARTWRPRVAK